MSLATGNEVIREMNRNKSAKFVCLLSSPSAEAATSLLPDYGASASSSMVSDLAKQSAPPWVGGARAGRGVPGPGPGSNMYIYIYMYIDISTFATPAMMLPFAICQVPACNSIILGDTMLWDSRFKIFFMRTGNLEPWNLEPRMLKPEKILFLDLEPSVANPNVFDK